jgi:hypothetical protein
MEKFGSRIRYKHPGSATLVSGDTYIMETSDVRRTIADHQIRLAASKLLYYLVRRGQLRNVALAVKAIDQGVTIDYRTVLYSDFVTILRLASLQYITKLAMSQSQKPWSPLPQNIK